MKPILIVPILLLAAFFRFYNFYPWISFGMDQEYQALISQNIVSLKHFPLIGVNASDTGLYLGPLFSYFSAVIHLFSSGNPAGSALIASILGIVVTLGIYIIGKKMFSERAAMLAAFFYGSSFLAAFYDRQFWNPNPVPLVSLVIGYSLFLLIQTGKKAANRQRMTIIVLALLLGISTHIHLSLMVFVPFIIIAFWLRRKVIVKKDVALFIAIVVLFQAPVILFDIRHGGINANAIVKIVSGKSHPDMVSSAGQRYQLLFDTIGRYFWVSAPVDLSLESGQCRETAFLRKTPANAIRFLILFLIAVFSIRYYHVVKSSRNERYGYHIAAGILILALLTPLVYAREIFEYYYLFLFPWLAIIFAVSLEYFWKLRYGRAAVYSISVLFLTANILTLFTAWTQYSYTNKLEAVSFIKKNIGDAAYSLEALGECQRFGGYRYLVTRGIGRAPVSSYMDSYFSWLYDSGTEAVTPEKTVLVSAIDYRSDSEIRTSMQEERIRFLKSHNILTSRSFGDIDVFIVE